MKTWIITLFGAFLLSPLAGCDKKPYEAPGEAGRFGDRAAPGAETPPASPGVEEAPVAPGAEKPPAAPLAKDEPAKEPVAEGARPTKEELERMQKELRQMEERLDELDRRPVGEAVKARWDETRKDLREGARKVGREIEEAAQKTEAVTKEAWEDTKTGLKRLGDDIEKAFEDFPKTEPTENK